MAKSTISIGLILPTVEIASKAKAVAADLNLQDVITCRVGNHIEGLEWAKSLEEEGVDVFISRRSTADLIQEHLQTPTVIIGLTLQDIAQALADARQLTGLHRPRIGFFAMPSDQANLESFAKLLNFDLHLYFVTPNEEYLELMVQRAIADKMDIIAAGVVVTRLAHRYNMPSLLLDCGPVALRTVLMDAQKVAYARRLEKIRAENFRVVVEKSSRGILVIDRKGHIQVANPMACSILGYDSISPANTVDDILPELGLKDLLPENIGERKDLFVTTSKGSLVVDITPIHVLQSVSGVVITIQQAEALSEISVITKKKLYSQRFVSSYNFANIIGESPEISATKQMAKDYAASDGMVLISGETGTGKELFAHAIHSASAFRHGPFIAFNCAALPSSLLESELFGFEEGAFTGATRKGKPGLFEMAHQGTVFIDEISELNKQFQMRLLRVLQERQVMRLGGSKMVALDIRVISATNKHLWSLVQQGRFREDLYYRISMLPLYIPPLRERTGDVPLLAQHIAKRTQAKRHSRIHLTKDILQRLEQHTWPGNVRELQNVMERIAVAAHKGHISPEQVDNFMFPDRRWGSETFHDTNLPEQPGPLKSNYGEREKIIKALEQCNGHRGQAAEVLGINRSTLFRKMIAYDIKTLAT